jgi:hypothetical protein
MPAGGMKPGAMRRNKATNVLPVNLWVPSEKVPCESDPELWSDAGGSGTYAAENRRAITKGERMAMEICTTVCPLMDACLTSAMREEGKRSASSRFGIRGGLMPHQRATLARDTGRKR